MSNTLLPCPFCGGKARWMYRKPTGRVMCKKCGASSAAFSDNYEEADCQQEAITAWNRRTQPEIAGNTSDGYHTFNELYHHRAVLFSVICNSNPEIAWKSKLHHDGTMYDGMFIVGVETPDGQATYHYDIDPYWEMFDVQELPKAPEWDGHTPTQAIERIGKLRTQLENSRQHALQTGVCPMCEDCPDGCPVETPKDSRNIVTNADCIRSMNDEELARFLWKHRYWKSVEKYLDWLQQPVKEEHYGDD
jgi:Lar family restriction alleviation protein